MDTDIEGRHKELPAARLRRWEVERAENTGEKVADMKANC